MHIIAHIENDLPQKFGIPRQSGLVDELISTIVFEEEYRNMDALRGLEDFDYIWIIWEFEEISNNSSFSPTVRPPRLGGNTRMGVFATRSPNRPNPIGLSCVKILDITDSNRGPIIRVSGADLRNQTKIYDIKPYLPYTDAHPDAASGFAGEVYGDKLEVIFNDDLLKLLPIQKQKAAIELLKQDPRPSYHTDQNRVYGMCFADKNIKFKVNGNLLTVVDVSPLAPQDPDSAK